MMHARIWGRDIEMQGGPWAFVEYRRAFGGDLLSDYIAAVRQDTVQLYDYLRICWAMCRTAGDDADFEAWCDSFTEFTLADGEGAAFVSVVDSAVAAEMFRPRETRFGRLRRKLREGWLGLLSRRRRAREARLLTGGNTWPDDVRLHRVHRRLLRRGRQDAAQEGRAGGHRQADGVIRNFETE